MKTKILFLTSFIFTLFSIQAQIIHVPGDYSTIQEGINASNDGDTVLVAEDTYYENINFLGKSITVASNYIIEGDTNFINNTVIDGSQPANPDNGSVVTFSSGEDSTSIICGFTITGGTGTYINSVDQRYGGGIYCNYAGAKIINNKILNNSSEYSNHACGGGIGCRFGSAWIVIRDNIIRDNMVSSDNIALGGGIYSRYNSIIISNNIISYNLLFGPEIYGGAACLSFTDNTYMNGNIIFRNEVYSSYAYWNGVYFYKPIGPVRVFQNEFSYNEGEFIPYGYCGGLGFREAYDYEVIVDCNRFLYNSAGYGGGFFEINCYNLQLTNNVFIGNEAVEGGAIKIYNDISSYEERPRIINNTFINNSAETYGGAISYIGGVIGFSPVILNCIFWENSAQPGGGQDIDNYSSDSIFIYYSDIDTNLITGQWIGEFNIYEDPELEADGIHLTNSSPCINMGIDAVDINETIYSCPDHDIDSESRPLNNYVEIGADEKHFVGIVDFGYKQDVPSVLISPNPFSVFADIHFNLQSAGHVELSIYNNSGEKLRVIIKDELQAGLHHFKLNSLGLPSGIYFCILKTDTGKRVNKIIKL